MENYIITPEEKKDYIHKYPIFQCSNSIGVDYGNFISIKCTILTGTCTYANSKKNEYLNCKYISNNNS